MSFTLACSNPSCYLNYHPCCLHRQSQYYPMLANQASPPPCKFHAKYRAIMLLNSLGNSDQTEPPVPAKPPSPEWKKWAVGIVLFVALPSYRHKWGPLAFLEEKVNTTVETMESVAETVEDVAEDVEKVADQLEDKLPADYTKTKKVVESVDNFSKQTVKVAGLAQDRLDKVDDLEEDVKKRMMENKSFKVKVEEVKKDAEKTIMEWGKDLAEIGSQKEP